MIKLKIIHKRVIYKAHLLLFFAISSDTNLVAARPIPDVETVMANTQTLQEKKDQLPLNLQYLKYIY